MMIIKPWIRDRFIRVKLGNEPIGNREDSQPGTNCRKDRITEDLDFVPLQEFEVELGTCGDGDER